VVILAPTSNTFFGAACKVMNCLNGFKDFGVFYFCSFLVLMEKESLSLSLQSKGKSSNKFTKDRKNKKKVFPKNKQTAFLLYHFFFFEKREKRF